MGKIPDRWLEYKPLGKRVQGTRFIAFKTPLKETFTRLTLQDSFTPDQLFKNCPQLGMIIDLTNTTKYYNKEDILKRGVEYEKVKCPGQVIPPLSAVLRFFKVVDNFLCRHKNDEFLIGVHCTHGVNRTGYFLCRYMIQRMGCPLSKAVTCVEKARGYAIERRNYVDHLGRCTSPIAMSLNSPAREMSKESTIGHRGRKSGPGIHREGSGGDIRASPHRTDIGEMRRTRSHSRSPQRQHSRKYVSQRDKERLGNPFDDSNRASHFVQSERYGGRGYVDEVSIHVSELEVKAGPGGPWAGPHPNQNFSCFEEESQIRFVANDFDDRKHYIERIKGPRRYSPVPAGRADFKERYPSRRSPWEGGDRFPPNFDKSSFPPAEQDMSFDRMPYNENFGHEKSGRGKPRKDGFREDPYKRDHGPSFPGPNLWKFDNRNLEPGGFNKMGGHSRRSSFSRSAYPGKPDKGWSGSGDVRSRHFDGKHERADRPSDHSKHVSPPRRSDRSPLPKEKKIRDKLVEKERHRSRSPFTKRPLFVNQDPNDVSRNDNYIKRSLSAENIPRYESDGHHYPNRFHAEDKSFGSSSRLDARMSPQFELRRSYRKSNEYFRSKEERRIDEQDIPGGHKPFLEGPSRPFERDAHYQHKQGPKKNEIRHFDDPIKYKKERMRSPSPHRSRYYMKDRLSPAWVKDKQRMRHASPPNGGNVFRAPDFYMNEELQGTKYPDSPGRKTASSRLQERDLRAGGSSYERRGKKDTDPRQDSPRAESPHHLKGRYASKHFSPEPAHYSDRGRDRFSPGAETIVRDKVHPDVAYHDQDVDCRNIINQKRFYRPDSANQGKHIFPAREQLGHATKRGHCIDMDVGHSSIDRGNSFDMNEGRFRFVAREESIRVEAEIHSANEFFVENNDLRQTLQRSNVQEEMGRRESTPVDLRNTFSRDQGGYGERPRGRFDFGEEAVRGGARRARKSREKTPPEKPLSLRLGPPAKKTRREPVKPKILSKEPLKSTTWRKKSLGPPRKRR